MKLYFTFKSKLFFLVIPTVLLSEINLYAVKIEENQLIIKLTAYWLHLLKDL